MIGRDRITRHVRYARILEQASVARENDAQVHAHRVGKAESAPGC